MLFSLVFAVIFGVLAVFFANDNQAMVQVSLWGMPLAGKIGILLVVAFGMGALLGVLMMLPAYLSQGWALVRSKRKVEDLERAQQPDQTIGSKQV